MDSCAKYMIRDVPTVSDAVSTYASCDPCVACAERIAVTNEHGKTYLTDIGGVK